MIKFIVKSSINLFVCFFILSIPINNRELFNHINDRTGPVTKQLYVKINREVRHIFKKSTNFGKKLFNNSVPIGKLDDPTLNKTSASDIETMENIQVTDSIREEFSGLIREGIESDIYTPEEKARLREKIRKNKKGHH